MDTADQALLDLRCSTLWPNDAAIGPQLAARNTDRLVSLAADKGYDSMAFRRQLRAAGGRPLIKHRLYQPIDHVHNARLDANRYNQRSLVESVNSSIKRTLRETVQSRLWYCQFHELVLIASAYNVERSLTQ